MISSTGIYHIMGRGNNKEWIFEREEDKSMFYHVLKETKEQYPFQLYAYCIMQNHYHLVVKTDTLEGSMKRLNQHYAMYYNSSRNRVGHVFQDRFKSVSVEDNAYFLGVIRYVHLNPVAAGLVQDPYQYKWCSYKEYFYETPLMVDSGYVKENVCPEREFFKRNFIQLHRGDDDRIYLDTKEEVKERKAQIANRVFQEQGGVNVDSVNLLRDRTGLTFREIAKFGNISINQVNNYLQKGQSDLATE
jgi:REP element-mobilizing transposase RayT